LSVRAQSTAEIEAKLAARGVDRNEAAAVVDDALRLGFLDDEALAGQLARGFVARGYGRRRAEQALSRRGIAGPLATAALDEAYGEIAEDELACRALGRRPVDGLAERRRAVGFLLRRGFPAGAAWRAVARARPP
jgi:SOS response regulatory protein OraA/RecX